jgi:hypothetical protein
LLAMRPTVMLFFLPLRMVGLWVMHNQSPLTRNYSFATVAGKNEFGKPKTQGVVDWPKLTHHRSMKLRGQRRSS